MQTITFQEFASNTLNPFYDLKVNTVAFQGTTFLDTGGPVIVSDGSFAGTISWTFGKAVSQVGFDVGYLDAVGTLTVKFLDAHDHVLKTMHNTQPNQHFAYASGKGISRVVVHTNADQYALDNVSFNSRLPQTGLTHNQDIDGILWGWKWDHKDLTYSFPTSSNEYFPSGYAAVNGFEALNSSQKSAYAGILDNIGGVCGLGFTQTSSTQADIRFAEANSIDYGDGNGAHTPGNNTAEGNPPDTTRVTGATGDVWFNHSIYDNPNYGSFAFAAGLMHELGHALGLKHGHTTQTGHGVHFPALPTAHNSFEYSIMTYTQYPGDPTPYDSAVDHPTTLMQDDIAALQHLYGADFSYRKTDTVYTFDANEQMFVNGQGQGTPVNHHALLTIWDGGGTDTYDFSNKSANLVIDLRPGHFSTFGAKADLGEGHLAKGNVANALLYKHSNASLIERAIGGSGEDKLYGNNVRNVLTGNAGADQFLFATGLNARRNVDTITDFTHGQDRIGLDNAFFRGLHPGQMSKSEFEAHIDYVGSSGALLFDQDGKGGHGAVRFAELDRHLQVTYQDFLVI